MKIYLVPHNNISPLIIRNGQISDGQFNQGGDYAIPGKGGTLSHVKRQ